jgi:hypothetical protein
VTHLVVKENASPQKARAAKRDSVKDSPTNPFRDTGAKTLTQKAEEMGMKVWTMKSEL